jgi:rhodanese-related sulfurtransferase
VTQPPLEISVHEVHALRTQGENLVLVDCREPDEHALVAIDGAKLIPLGEFPARYIELEPWQQGHVVVHCHHGGRSARAAQWLRENGFPQAQSMAGGIDSWATEISPGMPRY